MGWGLEPTRLRNLAPRATSRQGESLRERQTQNALNMLEREASTAAGGDIRVVFHPHERLALKDRDLLSPSPSSRLRGILVNREV